VDYALDQRPTAASALHVVAYHGLVLLVLVGTPDIAVRDGEGTHVVC